MTHEQFNLAKSDLEKSLGRRATDNELGTLTEELANIYPNPDVLEFRVNNKIRDIAERANFLETIKPCPVCQKNDQLRVDMGQSALVLCSRCNLCGPGLYYVATIWHLGPEKIKACAISLWNNWTIYLGYDSVPWIKQLVAPFAEKKF